jgi:hypothetical protein
MQSCTERWWATSDGRTDAGDGGRGDAGTRRHGDAETRRRGDTETRRRGDTEKRRRGDTETRRHGDTETRGRRSVGDTGFEKEAGSSFYSSPPALSRSLLYLTAADYRLTSRNPRVSPSPRLPFLPYSPPWVNNCLSTALGSPSTTKRMLRKYLSETRCTSAGVTARSRLMNSVEFRQPPPTNSA